MILHFLGGPYTHPDPLVREERHWMMAAASMILFRRGENVVCPITMLYPVDVLMAGEDTMGSTFWTNFTLRLATTCERFTVARIPGWEVSNGLRREIEHFEGRGVAPDFIEMDEISNLLRAGPVKGG